MVVRSRATTNFFCRMRRCGHSPYFTHGNCISASTTLPIYLTCFPASHQFWLHEGPGLYLSRTHKETRMNKREIHHHSAKSSISFKSSFVEIRGRRFPFVVGTAGIKNGLKKLDGDRIKTTLAAKICSNPGDLTTNSKCSILVGGPYHISEPKFVIGGKFTQSPGYKIYGHAAILPCRFVNVSSLPPANNLKDAVCHLSESSPNFQSLGNPTVISKLATGNGESFFAIKVKTVFDSPGRIGTIIKPTGRPLKKLNPSGRLVIIFIRLARHKYRFVKVILSSGESPICIESTTCCSGCSDFVRSAITHNPIHATHIKPIIHFLNFPPVNL